MSENAPTPTPPSTDTPLQPKTRVALFLAWLVFLVLTAIPAGLSLLGGLVLAIWLISAQATLRTGGLSGSDVMFTAGLYLGLLLAGVSLLGVILRRLGRPRLETERRNRIIGPGGRVLSIVYQRGSAVATKPLLSWIPDLPVLALLLVFVLYLGDGGHRWLPSVLSLMIIIANLYLLLIYLPIWIGRFGWRFSRRLYRFAGQSSFRAGMFTILFLLPTALEILGVSFEHRSHSSDDGEDSYSEPFDRRIDRLDRARTFAELQRRAFLETADAWWTTRAFDAEVRHFFLPLFDAARDPYESQEISFAPRFHRAWIEEVGGSLISPAWAQDSDDVFATCVHTLYPTKVGRAARRVRLDYRLSDDDSDDVALGALLSICENYEARSYRNLEAAYFLAVGRSAKKRVDPNRKYRREVTSSALGSMFSDCGEPTDFLESCPSGWSSPEEDAARWEEISMVKWCELSRLQRTIILQKAVLGLSDDEIGELHTGMSPAKVKNIYQNARRKVREKLAGSCRNRDDRDGFLERLERNSPSLWR